MKKIVSLCLALLLSLTLLASPVWAGAFQSQFEQLGVSAEGVYIENLDTGVVMYEKNAHTQMSAASLTKLVTTMILLEKTPDLDERKFEAVGSVFDIISQYDSPSHADIKRGAVLSGRELLYAMMLPSANEAAYIVAYNIGGGNVSNFVYLMNAKAKQMGCLNTEFVDPCGLEPGNMTTAYDMAQIIKYMSNYMDQRDLFAEVCKTTSYQMPAGVGFSTSDAYNIWTTDLLIDENRGDKYYRAYTQGGKTGSLEDWQNFAAWHQQGDMRFVSAVLHASNTADKYQQEYYPTKTPKPALYETCVLMDWVYNNFRLDNALDTGAFVTERPVKYSTQADTVKLYPKEGLYTILPNESDESTIQRTYDLPETLAAPIKQGDVVGTVTLSLAGESIGTVELIAGSNIDRNMVLYVISRIGEFFSSLYFRVLLVLVAITAVIYLVLFLYMNFTHKGDGKIRHHNRY